MKSIISLNDQDERAKVKKKKIEHKKEVVKTH